MTLPRREHPHSTAQAAEALGIPERAIRVWKTRGLIAPVGMLRGQGRGGFQPLYRLTELEPLAAAWHRRAATRRERASSDGSGDAE